MTQLCDIYAYIKLILPSNGYTMASGSSIDPRDHSSALVRFVLVNDSHMPTGTFTTNFTLRKDGALAAPSPVVKQLQLQPKEVFTFEMEVPTSGLVNSRFDAVMLADIGNFNKEETEANNKASAWFNVIKQPN